MIALQDVYRWKAYLSDGSVVESGESLKDAVMVSFIPAVAGLPAHDFAGLTFKRRFVRYFKRATLGGFDYQTYFAEMERHLSDERRQARENRDSNGRAAKDPVIPPRAEGKTDACLSVIMARECRIYINHMTGAVLVSPPDYEVYL